MEERFEQIALDEIRCAMKLCGGRRCGALLRVRRAEISVAMMCAPGNSCASAIGDAAGARANICDAKRGILRRRAASRRDTQTLESDFDYVLGFRTRNQDIGRDFEVQAPEFLMAGKVLRRDSAGAPRDQGEISLARRRVEFLFRMCVKPCAVAPERVHQQQFGSKRRGGNVLAFELRDGVAEGGAE